MRLLPEIALRGLMSEKLLNDVMPLIQGSTFVVRLYRNSLGHRKAHAGTISLEYDNCPVAMSTKQVIGLLKALRDEINHLCSCVAAAGYHLTKAIRPAEEPLVFTRKTRNFTLIVTEVEPEHDETEWDNATVDQRLKAVLDEKTPSEDWKSVWSVAVASLARRMPRLLCVILKAPFGHGSSDAGCVR